MTFFDQIVGREYYFDVVGPSVRPNSFACYISATNDKFSIKLCVERLNTEMSALFQARASI